MRSLPTPDEWIALCKRNDTSTVKRALHERGWLKNGAEPSDTADRQRINAYWAHACKVGAHKTASCLPALGFVPTVPYGPELEGAIEGLLAHLGKHRWSPSKTPQHFCWAHLLRCLPELSTSQARLLAQAGRHEDLASLLLRRAWRPRPEVFFEVARSMEECFGHQGDYLLDAAQRADPSLVAQQTEAFRRSLGRLLDNHTALLTRQDKATIAERETALVRLHKAIEPFGGTVNSRAILKLAERGSLTLVSALGAVGYSLPDLPQAQRKFFAAMLESPFQGEGDPRLREQPWRTWAHQALEGAWEASCNPRITAAWSAWRLEQALAIGGPAKNLRRRL